METGQSGLALSHGLYNVSVGGGLAGSPRGLDGSQLKCRFSSSARQGPGEPRPQGSCEDCQYCL